MVAYGHFLMSASFGMVAISMVGLNLQANVQTHAKLEEENQQLRAQLEEQQLTADLSLSEVHRSVENELGQARASARLAVTQAGELVIANKNLAAAFEKERRHRKLLETRIENSLRRNQSLWQRVRAAESLTELTEAHALMLDSQLSEALALQETYREDNKHLRAFASRHLPEVAPVEAEKTLGILQRALTDAKADQSPSRRYRIGMACSGLRTFQASASGYSCRLGMSLLAKAKHLRNDPACVDFESKEHVQNQTAHTVR